MGQTCTKKVAPNKIVTKRKVFRMFQKKTCAEVRSRTVAKMFQQSQESPTSIKPIYIATNAQLDSCWQQEDFLFQDKH